VDVPEGFHHKQPHAITTTIQLTNCNMSGAHPSSLTPPVLDTLRSQPGMPGDMWYAVVAATLCVLNRPEEIPDVYRHAVASVAGAGAGTAGAAADHARQLRIARRLREALLKTSAIGGLPKVSKQASRQQQCIGEHRTAVMRGQTLTPASSGVPSASFLMLSLSLSLTIALLTPSPEAHLCSRPIRLTRPGTFPALTCLPPPRGHVDHQRPPGAQEGCAAGVHRRAARRVPDQPAS
jgi:hypothetical protein